MKAILCKDSGGPEVLFVAEVPSPSCGPEEVRIRVFVAGINRADLLQRRGLYPPPKGASSILGLEVAGTILEIGDKAKTSGFSVGQKVMALLTGGGYAEEVVVPVNQVMEVPRGFSLEQAAAIPETYITAYLNIFLLGQGSSRRFSSLDAPYTCAQNFSKENQQNPSEIPTVFIHGGASGVGTAAISLCRESGFLIGCTVGSAEGEEKCKTLGAHFTWNYHQGDFAEFVLRQTDGRGVDIVLDCIGAKYLQANLQILALEGRLVCIGLQGGSKALMDLETLLDKRIQILGSTLRSLPLTRKAFVIQKFRKEVLPLFEQGRLTPIVDKIFPLEQVALAHQALEGPHFGKLVLQIS